MKIGNLEVRNTKDLFGPWTRLCACMWAKPKIGKTRWAGELDKVTKTFYNKPTLFIAVEAADGGGTMSIRDSGVDFVEPKSWTEFCAIVAALQSDQQYGGVVVDNASDLVKRYIQPEAIKLPYDKGTPPATRAKGVPAQGDYQTMGEMLRGQLNSLINLTKRDVPDTIRKHVVVTALEYERTTRDGLTTVSVGPALPGQMADTASAMFQTMLTLDLEARVVPNPRDPKNTTRIYERVVVSETNGVKILGDRLGIFRPRESVSLFEVFEKRWIPIMEGKEPIE